MDIDGTMTDWRERTTPSARRGWKPTVNLSFASAGLRPFADVPRPSPACELPPGSSERTVVTFVRYVLTKPDNRRLGEWVIVSQPTDRGPILPRPVCPCRAPTRRRRGTREVS